MEFRAFLRCAVLCAAAVLGAVAGGRAAPPRTLAALQLRRVAEHRDTLGAHIAFSADGRRFFTSGAAWDVIAWDGGAPGRRYRALVGDGLALSADGRRLLTERGALDLASGAAEELPLHLDRGYERATLAMAADQRHGAVAVRFRPPRTAPRRGPGGTSYHAFGPTQPSGSASYVAVVDRRGVELRRLLADPARRGPPQRLLFTARHLLALDGETRSLRIFDRATWAELPPLPLGAEDAVTGLALSADEALLGAYGGSEAAEPAQSTARALVFELASRRLLGRIARRGAPVHALAFLPGTRCLATGDGAGHLDLWQLRDGGEPERLGGDTFPRRPEPQRGRPFSDRVSALAFSPRGDRLIVGLDLDGEDLLIYDVAPRYR